MVKWKSTLVHQNLNKVRLCLHSSAGNLTWSTGQIKGDGYDFYYEISSFKDSGDTCAIICGHMSGKLINSCAILQLITLFRKFSTHSSLEASGDY